MAWSIKTLRPYRDWFDGLAEDVQDCIVELYPALQELGPTLPRPGCDRVKGSKFSNMKELRAKHGKHLSRILFAFDKQRNAVLILGGDKMPEGSYDEKFYEKNIPIADKLFEAYLEQQAKVQAEEKGHGKGKTKGRRRR